MGTKINQIGIIEEALNNYNYYKKMIRAYNMLLQQNNTIKGIAYDSEKTKATNKFHSDVEARVLKKEELQTRVQKLQNTINNIDIALSTLDNDSSTILKKYYIEDESWVAISQDIHMSERQCMRIRDHAIDKMQSLLFAQIEDKKTGNIQLGLDIKLDAFQI
ncbi:hypothetical protein SH1V18_15060 [Vallitalea longa]|uniref:Uncharacterized protein n=1 Tax=Vallitalea longa TaxID=2936439 RepID=A0A9W6DDK7_9FIRM|nr:hypothetical protein [Vallitalea longa]GKX29026.1 hypothetical protein SH1V18_15060 [Vallitalea longa]